MPVDEKAVRLPAGMEPKPWCSMCLDTVSLSKGTYRARGGVTMYWIECDECHDMVAESSFPDAVAAWDDRAAGEAT